MASAAHTIAAPIGAPPSASPLDRALSQIENVSAELEGVAAVLEVALEDISHRSDMLRGERALHAAEYMLQHLRAEFSAAIEDALKARLQ